MSTPAHDQLYRFFESHLHSGDYDERPTEVFLRDVVEAYWSEVEGDTKIPLRMQEHVKSDLIEDVRDMLRIKIYGNSGIGEYNRRREKTSEKKS